MSSNPLEHHSDDELVAAHSKQPADNHFLSEMLRRHDEGVSRARQQDLVVEPLAPSRHSCYIPTHRGSRVDCIPRDVSMIAAIYAWVVVRAPAARGLFSGHRKEAS